MGAVGSGQEAGSSAVSGALAGGLAGTGIGTLGPLMRAGIISKQFGPKMDQALKDFDTKSARRFDKFKIDDYVTQSRTKRIDTDIDAANTKLTDIEAKLRKTNLAIKQRKGSNNPADAAALQRLEVLRNAHLKNRANMESKINQLESSRNNISMLRRQTEQGRKGMTDRIADERKALEAQKKKGPSFIPEDLSRSGKMEAAGVPALSTLVGGGLGFGVSHDAKEQERYRQFRQR
jgi:hypothetical protein